MTGSAPRSLGAALIIAAIWSSACARPPSHPSVQRAAAFEAGEIWDGDGAATLTRLGLPVQAIYRLDSLNQPIRLPMPKACCITGLTLSPRGDRIAYFAYGADPPVTAEDRAVTGVRVVDAAGAEIAWFPGCHAPRWSVDGSRLAMIEGKYPPEVSTTFDPSVGWLEPVAVRVVDRSGRSRTFPHQPRRLSWGNGDTLFLEYEDRVEALDVAHSRTWPTTHVGCEVSPDGRYSFRYQGSFGFFRLSDDAAGLGLGRCVLSKFGFETDNPPMLIPFWIRSTTRTHLLCLSVTPTQQSPPGQAGVRTVVLDPGTMEFVHEIPGKLVTPTNDHRAVVLLRGDTLARVDLPIWPPEPARLVIGRLRMQVYEWDSPAPRLLTDSTYAVAAGDWLRTVDGFDPCGDLRVVRATANSRLELELRTPVFYEPGAGPAPVPPHDQAARYPRPLFVGTSPVMLRTNSVDGGYDVVLSLVR